MKIYEILPTAFVSHSVSISFICLLSGNLICMMPEKILIKENKTEISTLAVVEKEYKRGDIYWVYNEGSTVGSEIMKSRPAVIISNDKANKQSKTVLVAFLTTNAEKIFPNEILINCKGKKAKILLEQQKSIDKRRFGTHLGVVGPEVMKNIEDSLIKLLDLPILNNQVPQMSSQKISIQEEKETNISTPTELSHGSAQLKAQTTEAERLEEGAMLRQAACDNKIAVIQSVIQSAGLRHLYINSVDVKNGTALNYAVCKGHCDIVELLLKRNAKTEIPGKCYYSDSVLTPLQHGALLGRDRAVELLIAAGASVDSEVNEGYGCRAIDYAAREGHANVVEILIKNGAEIGWNGYVCPIREAALGGKHKIVKIIYTAFFERAKQESKKYKTVKKLLHWAAIFDSVDIAKKLLSDKNVDQNAADDFGFAPLHYAAITGSANVASLLLARQAEKTAFDANDHYLPLQWAILNGQHKIVELLLLGDANWQKMPDPYVSGPLFLAARKGDLEMMKILLKHGAHINGLPDVACSPLHGAIFLKHFQAIQFLLDSGADVNIQTDYGTPLHAAAESGNTQIVHLLLVRGAHKNSVNSEGLTPSMVAANKKYYEIAKLLALQ